MKAFKVVMKFEEKAGFSEVGLKKAIQDDLSEIGLKLLNFSYACKAYDSAPDYPAFNKKLSGCECIIEYKEFSCLLPYHQIVLGGLQGLSEKYPFYEINSIEPSVLE